jgi:hypothetical protein
VPFKGAGFDVACAVAVLYTQLFAAPSCHATFFVFNRIRGQIRSNRYRIDKILDKL